MLCFTRAQTKQLKHAQRLENVKANFEIDELRIKQLCALKGIVVISSYFQKENIHIGTFTRNFHKHCHTLLVYSLLLVSYCGNK